MAVCRALPNPVVASAGCDHDQFHSSLPSVAKRDRKRACLLSKARVSPLILQEKSPITPQALAADSKL
jgi:hypothetical protein